VIVGKWIYRDTEIFIFDEPTRGIDVNSKAEIYALMVDLLKDGKSIIMISSDMPELISISDRVLIIKKGEIAAQLEGDEIAEKNIISKTI
jgi:ribose transport system ATP-binding protein